VPGLNVGGWHDAGDYDLRVESQAGTILGLSWAWELFHPQLDETTVDQKQKLVLIHRPDGKPDMLQQIEHGALSIVGGYKSMGCLYRGIQDASLHQYTHLGDAATMTDNIVFMDDDKGTAMKVHMDYAKRGDQSEPKIDGLPPLGFPGSADDRWVFTEDNPLHEMQAAAALAATSRAMKGYNNDLSEDCLRIAGELWDRVNAPADAPERILAAVELLVSTGDPRYKAAIIGLAGAIESDMEHYGWLGARAIALVDDGDFTQQMRAALEQYRAEVDILESGTPYGIPYEPVVWGAGWGIQDFGVHQYFLHKSVPDIFPSKFMLHAIDFVLGCHPGPNNASLVSGVGAKSVLTAYGVNRADWSYIPGGSVSGTALIRPDFPELLDWPFLWQQTEYCLGIPTSDYVFLILAAKDMLAEEQ
jgi:hypothetical protein